MPTFDSQDLQRFLFDVFRAAGTDVRDASIVAQHLIDANLAGHDSHGAMRLVQYVEEIDAGRIRPRQQMQIIDAWECGGIVDGSGVFGQVACHDAMQLAIDKARTSSVAAVTLRNANHSGRLGTYVEMAAQAGMIGLAMANAGGAGQWVAPFGGCEPRLSTNPLAFGAPSGKPFPVVLDMSTSIAPEGKVRNYLQREEPIPDGWLVDAAGQSSNDPHQLYATPPGALLPLGGMAGGHKGYGLGFMVDVFAGALSAAGCPHGGTFDPLHGSGLFLLVIDIERFRVAREFIDQVSGMADYVRSSKPAAGFERILIPGEYEHEQRERRRKQGIDIPNSVWQAFRAVAKRFHNEQHEILIPVPRNSEETA